MLRNQHQPPISGVSAPQGFAEWGLDEVAYVKLERIGGQRLHVVHAANGESLAAADSHALAAAMIVQNGLTPVYVH